MFQIEPEDELKLQVTAEGRGLALFQVPDKEKRTAPPAVLQTTLIFVIQMFPVGLQQTPC